MTGLVCNGRSCQPLRQRGEYCFRNSDCGSDMHGAMVCLPTKSWCGPLEGDYYCDFNSDCLSGRCLGGLCTPGGIAAPYMNAQANTIDELQPIAFFGDDPNALQASLKSGIGSLKQYVEHARANPGKLKNGNDAPGGSSYIAVARYEKQLGIKVTRVPYGGFAPTVTALMAGEVDSATVPIPVTSIAGRHGTR